MNTLTLPHPGLDTNTQTIKARTVDLKQMHINAGLDRRDLQHLDSAYSWQRPEPKTFKGISIE